jgi:transcriptional regulator with XRE-family HTH domain
MEQLEKVRKRIRKIRVAKYYTQDYVGERLCMTQKSYHRLENGKSQLKLEVLFRLATILEVDVKSFLEDL